MISRNFHKYKEKFFCNPKFIAKLMIGVDLHGLKFEKQKDGAFGVTKYLNGFLQNYSSALSVHLSISDLYAPQS